MKLSTAWLAALSALFSVPQHASEAIPTHSDFRSINKVEWLRYSRIPARLLLKSIQ